MQKKLLLIAVVLIGVMVAVPAILVSFDHDDPLDGKSPSDQDEDISLNAGPEIKVYLTKEKKSEKNSDGAIYTRSGGGGDAS